MKKIYTILASLILTLSMYAQSPEAINYQAVVRDGSGNIIANQSIGAQISILQTTATGTVIFNETFTKTSNGFGLINLAIGTGTATAGRCSLAAGKGRSRNLSGDRTGSYART